MWTVAVAAVVGGHALVYALGPPAHEHTHALAESGHGHWPLPWLAAALLAVVGASVYGFTRAQRSGDSSWRALWPGLACGQVAGFLLLEVGERVAAGIGAGQLLDEPVILAGIVVQMAAAGVAAAVLRSAQRVAAWLVQPQAGRSVSSTVAHLLLAAAVVPPRTRPDRSGLTRRGPPVCC